MSTVKTCDRCGAELARHGPTREHRLAIAPDRKYVAVTLQPVNPRGASTDRPKPSSYELCTSCGTELARWLVEAPPRAMRAAARKEPDGDE